MASTDWTELGGSLSTASVLRNVTSGITPPNGGGTFVYAFNSIDIDTGAVGYFCSQANFIPTNKGGSIRAAMQKGVANTNSSGFIFVNLSGTATSNNGYLFGFQDEEPSHLALIKGPISNGIIAGAANPSGSPILMRSTITYSAGVWYHFRLDAIKQTGNDVTLKCYYSTSLGTSGVSSPTWVPIPGMETFTDDNTGINTGSVPYTAGRIGYGMRSNDTGRRFYIDHVEVLRQL